MHKPGRGFGIAMMLLAVCASAPLLADDANGPALPAPVMPSPIVYGHRERVDIFGHPTVEVTASLDPAAGASVLYVYDIKYFNKDSQVWAHFTVDNGRVLTGEAAQFQARVIDDSHVARKTGGITHEPRVQLAMCIGEKAFTATVNLVQRSTYSDALVLGAPELAQIGGHLDSARQFVIEPDCPPPKPKADGDKDPG